MINARRMNMFINEPVTNTRIAATIPAIMNPPNNVHKPRNTHIPISKYQSVVNMLGIKFHMNWSGCVMSQRGHSPTLRATLSHGMNS